MVEEKRKTRREEAAIRGREEKRRGVEMRWAREKVERVRGEDESQDGERKAVGGKAELLGAGWPWACTPWKKEPYVFFSVG